MEDFLNTLKEKAKLNRQRIVFPESGDERILRACVEIVKQDFAIPYLIGDANKISSRANELGISISGIEIRDPVHDVNFNDYCNEYVELRKHKGMTFEKAKEILSDYRFFGAMMVHKNHADGCISGATHPTSETIIPALQIIKTKPGFSIASSYFLMKKKDEMIFFADCGFVINPNSKELAEVAIATNDSAKEYNINPRVALLSFSTHGSAKHEMVDKVVEALKIVREKRPDIMIDGELQFDAAYVPKVAASKCPDSPLKGNANVFIFPDLNSGNICYKVTQRLGGYEAIGPLVQGLNKPMNDLSRGCSVQDVIDIAVITAVDAQTCSQK